MAEQTHAEALHEQLHGIEQLVVDADELLQIDGGSWHSVRSVLLQVIGPGLTSVCALSTRRPPTDLERWVIERSVVDTSPAQSVAGRHATLRVVVENRKGEGAILSNTVEDLGTGRILRYRFVPDADGVFSGRLIVLRDLPSTGSLLDCVATRALETRFNEAVRRLVRHPTPAILDALRALPHAFVERAARHPLLLVTRTAVALAATLDAMCDAAGARAVRDTVRAIIRGTSPADGAAVAQLLA
jgi:hypothetical protein